MLLPPGMQFWENIAWSVSTLQLSIITNRDLKTRVRAPQEQSFTAPKLQLTKEFPKQWQQKGSTLDFRTLVPRSWPGKHVPFPPTPPPITTRTLKENSYIVKGFCFILSLKYQSHGMYIVFLTGRPFIPGYNRKDLKFHCLHGWKLFHWTTV